MTLRPATPDPSWRSWGAFTTAGCDHGRPWLWDRHVSRLSTTIRELAPESEVSLPGLAEANDCLATSRCDGPARLRLTAVRDGADPAWEVAMAAQPVQGVGPEVPAISLQVVRWPAAPPLAGHKTMARLPWDLARRQVQAAGGDDALLVDAAERVLETSIANVFVRFGNLVVTPQAPRLCLPGILRGWLLAELPRQGFTVQTRDLLVGELFEADEVWVTNAVAGVRRVAAVGERKWSKWDAFPLLKGFAVPAPGWQ